MQIFFIPFLQARSNLSMMYTERADVTFFRVTIPI